MWTQITFVTNNGDLLRSKNTNTLHTAWGLIHQQQLFTEQ